MPGSVFHVDELAALVGSEVTLLDVHQHHGIGRMTGQRQSRLAVRCEIDAEADAFKHGALDILYQGVVLHHSGKGLLLNLQLRARSGGNTRRTGRAGEVEIG